MFAPFKRRSLAAGLGVAMCGTRSLYLKYKRLKNENAKDALVMVVCHVVADSCMLKTFNIRLQACAWDAALNYWQI